MEIVKIRSITPNPDNPRLIKNEKYKLLLHSVKVSPAFMLMNPIKVDLDNMILGGNMRYKACMELKKKEVPIEVFTREHAEINNKARREEGIEEATYEEQCREFIIKDNISFGEHDWDILGNEWDPIQLQEYGLDGFPFEDIELDAVEDDYTEPDSMKVDVVLGDLIEIGEHRLLCGDSTDSDQVAKLMDGKKANMSFTSPPYNAGKSESLSGNTHSGDNKYDSYNDNQKQDDYLNLLIGFTNNALLNSDYLICNIQSLAGNKIALIEYLNHYKNSFIDVAIWDKSHGAPQMAENVMTNTWEYLFFISSNQKASRAIPNANFRGTIPNIHRDKPQRNNEFSNVHAATFPIHLPEWALKFTKENDIVLDSFIGTGTTMVAAHQLKRKCYGMELDPKYCQVIIDRMIKLDDSLKVKINGKKYSPTK